MGVTVRFTKNFVLWLFILPLYICEVTQNEDGTGTISFSPPTLNDEEAHSMHVPDSLKCDACTAIAYQFTVRFKTAHDKRKSLKFLPESDLIDMAEEVCYGESLTKYGVKEVKKQKRLSGPGLETEEVPGVMQGGGKWPDSILPKRHSYRDPILQQHYLETAEVPGVMQGGGKWPDRLQRMCNMFVETFEEQGIYDAFLSEETSVQKLMCENDENPNMSDSCLPVTKPTKKKQKKKEEL